MKNDYKTRKANLIKEAIAEYKDELERLEIALENAETATYYPEDDAEGDTEHARRCRLGYLNDEICDRLDLIRSLYKDLATTY